MPCRTATRFRSDLVVKRAGRFTFDGYVEAGWKPPPPSDERIIELAIGQRFPQVGHPCWWARLDEELLEQSAEQRTNWNGGPAASRRGIRI